MAENGQYDHEYKVQAVKLARENGQTKAAKELEISIDTEFFAPSLTIQQTSDGFDLIRFFIHTHLPQNKG